MNHDAGVARPFYAAFHVIDSYNNDEYSGKINLIWCVIGLHYYHNLSYNWILTIFFLMFCHVMVLVVQADIFLHYDNHLTFSHFARLFEIMYIFKIFLSDRLDL